MPKKEKAFWESLSKDTKDIIAIFALLVGVLFLVFVIQNPVAGGLTIVSLLIIGGTFYWKIKTGNWWFQRSQPTTNHQPDDLPPTRSAPPAQQLPKPQPDRPGSPPFYTPPDRSEPPTTAALDHSSEVQSIISKIRQFRPQRRIRDERQYQDMLFGFMSSTFSLKTEVPFPNKKYIDAMVGEVGIELKFEPNESEFDRLYSQVESYLDHMQNVIIVISRPRSPHSLRYFEDKLRRRGWLDNRVFIIEQTM